METHALLIVTNGDAAVDRIGDSGVGSTRILAWKDVLHEGPVPNQPEAELRVTRSTFLATSGYGDRRQIEADLTRRDELLAETDAYDEVLLWFEHDLYDQLQLIQVLDRLGAQIREVSRVTLIVMPGYIGHASPDQLVAAYRSRVPVMTDLLRQGQRAWSAFTASSPGALAEISRMERHPLYALPAAIARLMQEFPDPVDGLTRTERFILSAASRASPITPRDLFSAYCHAETSVFMGDWSFWNMIRHLSSGDVPLISIDGWTFPKGDGWTYPQVIGGADEGRFLSSAVNATAAGREVLSGSANAITLRGLDRWIGGTHLRSEQHWCWDSKTNSLSGPHNSVRSRSPHD